MSFQITLDELPGGYTLSSVLKGEQASIIVREFTSSEDGDVFISRLEGLPTMLLNKLPFEANIRSSRVESMVAVINQDKTATVFINDDVKTIVSAILKRSVERGEFVYIDDYAEIADLQFDGIEFPPDSGVMVLLSESWRKGLFFDLGPLVDGNKPREYSVNKLLAHYYAYLLFQHIFKIATGEWDELIRQGWFPFIAIPQDRIKKMLGYLRSGWQLDDLLPEISDHLKRIIQNKTEAWSQRLSLANHIDFVQRAVERFLADDYISANSIIYPRIEGMMRDHHLLMGTGKASQDALINTVISSRGDINEYSALLPNNFRRFLKEVYFAHFDPNNPNPQGLSRNTVGHGVARSDEFTLKGAMLGLLTIDQMFYYLK